MSLPEILVTGSLGLQGNASLLASCQITLPSDADYTLTADEAACFGITIFGTITATRNINVPKVPGHFYLITNYCTAPQKLIINSGGSITSLCENNSGGGATLVINDTSGNIVKVSPALPPSISDVTASRAFATIYQNTSQQYMDVYVSFSGSNLQAIGLIGPTSPPTFNVSPWSQFGSSLPTSFWTASFRVPPGWFYEMTSTGGATIFKWIEVLT